MGWFSSLLGSAKSTFGSLGSSIGGSFSLQDATGGWSSYSATQSLRKDQMRREIDMAQRLAVDGPSWTMEGLRRAGINPILAVDSINSWSGQHGSLGGQAPSGGSTVGFKSKLDRDTTKMQQANINADTTLKEDQAKAATMQAQAALEQAQAAKLNAMTSSKRVDAEVKLMEKQGSNFDLRNPNESAWGLTDRIFGYSGDLLQSAGSAVALYGAGKYYLNKDKPKVFIGPSDGKPYLYNPKTGLSLPYTPPPAPTLPVPKNPGFWSRTFNSAKDVGPWLLGIGAGFGKAIVPVTIGGFTAYGAGKLGEKARKTIKDDPKSDYNQGHKYRVPNAFGIPNYW